MGERKGGSGGMRFDRAGRGSYDDAKMKGDGKRGKALVSFSENPIFRYHSFKSVCPAIMPIPTRLASICFA